MTDKKEVYEQIEELLRSLAPFYSERVTEHQYKLQAPNHWFALNNVRAYEPEPVTISQIHQQYPFASIKRQSENYAALAEAGLLQAVDTDTYVLTENGRELIEGFFHAAHKGLDASESPSPVGALSIQKMERLAKLLGQIVVASLEAPEPNEKLALNGSRWTDPGENASTVVKLDQYVTDLLRFRTDAHNAAWRKYDLGGRTWETFTQVEQGEAKTAAGLAERLNYRGYSADDYGASLSELEELGWLEEIDNEWVLTAKGNQIKQEVGSETDRIYFESWKKLGDTEIAELFELLSEANESLQHEGAVIAWELALKLGQTIPSAANDVVQPLFEKYFSEPATFFPTLMASGKSPESYSVKDHRQRFPYNSSERANQVLSDAAESGLLTTSNGGYVLSNQGRKAIDTVNDVFYSRLDEIDPLMDEDTQALADLLHKIVDASLEAVEPESKWSLANMHNCHPEQSYSSLAQIDQYLDDLNAFRDDVHIAVWQPYEIDGRSWETFTLVWRGEASTAEELVERLPFRGYELADYTQSLERLTERGWLRKSGDKYKVTKKGQAVRDEAEEKTNRYFFAPWKELSNPERFRIRALLTRTRLRIESLVENQEAEVVSA